MSAETPRRRRAKRAAWETVARDTERLEVPGGWIYRTVKRGVGLATCFVPSAGGDPQQLSALHRSARELKQKLEQLRGLLEQLSTARKLKNAPLRSTKVH
jgi:hypothetical protein